MSFKESGNFSTFLFSQKQKYIFPGFLTMRTMSGSSNHDYPDFDEQINDLSKQIKEKKKQRTQNSKKGNNMK